MRRAVFNTLCSLAVAAAFLWGSCAACRDLLEKREAAHCCQHNQCDRASHDSSSPGPAPAGALPGCEQMPWSYAGTQDAAAQIAQDSASSAVLPLEPPRRPPAGLRFEASPRLIAASPPDLPILHTALLI